MAGNTTKEDENLAKILKSISRNQVGRPRVEEDQPQVLQTILDIVDASSAAHDCRREQIRKLAVNSNLCHFWAFSEYMNCNVLILLKTSVFELGKSNLHQNKGQDNRV